MSLKFDVVEQDGEYAMKIATEETQTQIQATEAELRRLMIDLITVVGNE